MKSVFFIWKQEFKYNTKTSHRRKGLHTFNSNSPVKKGADSKNHLLEDGIISLKKTLVDQYRHLH